MSVHSKPSCEQIIDIIPDPFVVIDRDYHIVAANRAYRERYGVSDDGVVGRLCHEVSHHSPVPCSHNGEHCPLEEVFLHQRATQVMHVHFDRDGREEYVQLHASPLLDDAGEVRYIGESIFRVAPPEGEGEALLIGRARPLLRMTSLLQRVAPTQTTVLLLGESGVGKEQVAKYLHHYSNRAHRPFVVVDCGALGESLIESELFGHEKGSFTGASQRKKGLFEAADGGTLFIDEIGELPLPLQTKLLRVLETGTIRRIGGTDYVKIDVRIVAATNRNMQEMVANGRFRQDLYYRLSAFPVAIPPLRERKDDIPRLAEYFLARLEDADRHLPLSAEVIEVLLTYDYPGNVRELRNIIERAAILACDDALRPGHVVFDEPHQPVATAAQTHPYAPRLLDRRNGRLTDEAVMEALQAGHGHRGRAADLLGVSERTLYRYLRRLRPGD
ncbi:MAG: sigma 54-interacting transcriptional regulator [Thiohalobacteraceae bacterium]|nr:sigma 54-interacting transcriptional regulator [Gammaproteobacteria bacterium]